MGIVLLAGWLLWGSFGRVGLYETSEEAWIEQSPPPAQLEVASSGPVVRISEKFKLGTHVEEGDILVELDGTTERNLLAAKRAEYEGIPDLINNAEEKKEQLELLSQVVVKQSKAQSRKVKAALAAKRAELRAASEEARRLTKLTSEGVPEIDIIKKTADVRARRFDMAALSEGVEGSQLSGEREAIEARMRISELDSAITGLNVQRDALRAEISRLETELQRKVIVATQTGRLVKAAPIREGAMLPLGARIGTIITEGDVQIVALFSGASLSRLRIGQPCEMEVARFPRLIFGTRGCEVASISTELDNGMARVELRPRRSESEEVPFQHGMRGKVQVEVERVSPIELGMRTAGWSLDGKDADDEEDEDEDEEDEESSSQ